MPFEPLGKVRQVLESKVDGNLLDADFGLPQAALSVLNAEAVPELVRRGLEILSKKPDQMVRADVNRRSQHFQRQGVGKVTGVK